MKIPEKETWKQIENTISSKYIFNLFSMTISNWEKYFFQYEKDIEKDSTNLRYRMFENEGFVATNWATYNTFSARFLISFSNVL